MFLDGLKAPKRSRPLLSGIVTLREKEFLSYRRWGPNREFLTEIGDTPLFVTELPNAKLCNKKGSVPYSASSFALRTTASSMARVSRPVFVFCRLG